MSRWRVPLSVPEIGEAERHAFVDALDSGWPSLGPRTQAFEEAFARHAGVRHAVAVSSCTAALHLALSSLKLGAGDEVIVPSITFVATANAVVAAGGTPVFADITSLNDPCISADTALSVLSSRTLAIVVMHYGGMPCEMEALRRLSSSRGLALVEDAAHAVGTLLDGRPAGSLGDVGCFSFHATKNLTTVEGGMLTTDDAARAEHARRQRSHGMTALSWERHLGVSPDRDVALPGFNYKMDDLRAALGLAGLAGLAARNARRAAILDRYRGALKGSDRFALALGGIRPGRVSGSHLAALVVHQGRAGRDALVATLEARGIQTSHHYAPTHRMTCYRSEQVLPVTDEFAERQVTLPLFSTMTDEQVALVCEALG